MAEKTIVRGRVRKPAETTKGTNIEPVINYGIRTPGSSFDRRPESGPAPSYLGPSKMQDRSSAIKAGNSQKKKHKSTGRGQ